MENIISFPNMGFSLRLGHLNHRRFITLTVKRRRWNTWRRSSSISILRSLRFIRFNLVGSSCVPLVASEHSLSVEGEKGGGYTSSGLKLAKKVLRPSSRPFTC